MRKFKLIAGLLTAAMLISFVPTNSNAYMSGMGVNTCSDTILKYVKLYDVNNDGFFSEDELKNITTINMYGDKDVDNSVVEELSLFAYLEIIDISGCTNFTTLKLDSSNCAPGYGYTEIYANDTNLESIELVGCSSLKKLEVYNTNLSSINLGSCSSLDTLFIDGTNVNSLYLGACPLLSQLVKSVTVDKNDPSYDYYYNSNYSLQITCNSNCSIIATLPADCLNIDNATFSDSVARRYIADNCDLNHDGYLNTNEIRNITSITCRDLSSLEKLPYVKDVTIDNSLKDSLDFSNFSNLESIYLNSCDCITSLDLSNMSNLKMLSINGGNHLTSIDLSGCSMIDRLVIHDTNISSLDISGLTDIHYVEVYDNEGMTSLNIGNNPNLLEVYVDRDCTSYSYNRNNEITRWQYSVTKTDLSKCLIFGSEITIDTTQTIRPTTAPTQTPTTRPTQSPTATPVTPAPTTAPTATPAPTQTASSNQSESGVSGFVERLYTIALNRPSDPNGKADWVNRVYTQGATGADVAQGFLFSPEFLGKDMSNEDFLGVLYRVFFDRVGDQGGIDYWLENMANGMDKQTVIWGFINSTEWANVCLRFGIASGGNGVPNITIEPSAEIIEFATRLYTTCLGRNADQNGLMDWATQLANRQISGSQAAAGFFTSSEFVNANYENDEYINRLYRTFMGREADQGGFDYWMGRFAEGATREDVFNGFAGSQEWAGICSSYGILK